MQAKFANFFLFFFSFSLGKLSLAEQKELLKQKKEALLRKKAAQNAVPVNQETTYCELIFFFVFFFVFEVIVSPVTPSSKGVVSDAPIPLILDDQGRQVDAQGKLVSAYASKASSNKSLLINKRVEREKVFGKEEKLSKEVAMPKGMYDPRIGAAASKR
jgi:hypothetical protein